MTHRRHEGIDQWLEHSLETLEQYEGYREYVDIDVALIDAVQHGRMTVEEAEQCRQSYLEVFNT